MYRASDEEHVPCSGCMEQLCEFTSKPLHLPRSSCYDSHNFQEDKQGGK